MKSGKPILKTLTIAFLASGALLTIPGVSLFVAGGVGTYSLESKQGADSSSKLKSSGFFNQDANFKVITGEGGLWQFTEEIAKSYDVSYNIFGFIDYYLNKGVVTTDNPTNVNPELFNWTSAKELENYFNAIETDNALFITGAVLWPIGLVLLIIAMTLFIIFKVKNKK